MATLKNTTIPNLTVETDAIAQGQVGSAANTGSALFRSNAGSSYTTVGPVPFAITSLNENVLVTNANRFTVDHDGIYLVAYHNITNNTTALTRVNLSVNGGGTLIQARTENTSSYPNGIIFYLLKLTAGDFIELKLQEGQLYLTTGYSNLTIQKMY